MKPLWKYTLLIVGLLTIPAVPFLLFGEPMEADMERWLREQTSFEAVAAGVVGLLTIDVLLPVPSSIVCTLAGSFLGLFWGMLFATLGMTAGALLGFALGRLLGRPAMNHWIGPAELAKLDELVDRYGVAILVALRPVPLFAEASTLLLGCSRMLWPMFLLTTVPIHLLLALVYALLGKYLSLPVGVALSVAIALLLSLAAKKMLKM